MWTRRRGTVVPYLFVVPAVILLTVFVYAPALENIWWSLYQWSSFSPSWTFVGLGNYLHLGQDPIFWRSLVNNALYAVISVAVQVCFALVLAAILEAKLFSRRLSTTFRIGLFLPSILPVTVVGFLWQLLYQPSVGLINQLLQAVGLDAWSHAWLGEEGTALPATIAVSQWQWTGYIMVLFIVAIRAIPHELYEAMEIDGATKLQQFWRVTVPGVRETTLVLAMITIFGAFKVFDIVWVMTAGGPNNASEVLGTYMYRSAFRSDVAGYASAIATVIFVITFATGIVQIKLQRDE
jgi:raffinose/stachyose/melibiose transport system permease protein